MPTLQEQIQAIQDRYKPQIEELQRRSKKIVDDYEKPSAGGAVIGVDFKVDWKDEEIIFDIPSVTMKRNDVSLDIPEIFSKRETIIFHTPSVRMVNKKVGQYPEFHGFEVKWKDIIISLPEPFMQEQKIIFDLPYIKMKRQDWSFDVPEFTMERVRWVIGLPHFTIINVNAQTNDMVDNGNQLKKEGEEIGNRMRAEIESLIGGMKNNSNQKGSGAQNETILAYDLVINQLTTSINDLVAKGIDPIKVPTEGGDINLRKQLAEVIAQRASAIQKIENGIALV